MKRKIGIIGCNNALASINDEIARLTSFVDTIDDLSGEYEEELVNKANLYYEQLDDTSWAGVQHSQVNGYALLR